MKYMIMTFGSAEAGVAAMGKEWMLEMIQFMRKLDDDLRKSGELVSTEGLADGSQAKTVRIKNGIPVPTDGPFAEAKESLVGFWIVDVESEARAVVLIFTTSGCPIVQKSVPKIKALRDEFAAKGVIFWLINSTAQDDPASIRDEAREFAIDLPILLDRSQAVARSLKATRTAEAFCIDPRSRTLFYRGALDNQFGYGSERKKIDHAYLQNALNHFLSGKKIDPARTEVSGCRIQLD